LYDLAKHVNDSSELVSMDQRQFNYLLLAFSSKMNSSEFLYLIIIHFKIQELLIGSEGHLRQFSRGP